MSPPISFMKSKARIFEAETRLIRKFITDMNYAPLNINAHNKELEAFMVEVMDSRNIRCKQLERTVHLAASFIELCYPQISMEEKKTAALYNWFLIYVDDCASRDPMPFRHFEQRFARGLPQLDPVMDALADVLHHIWEQWEALSANMIISSALIFMNCSCIEVSLANLASPVPNNSRFAWFLREGTGIAKGFGSFGFSKSNNLSAMDYVQVVSDIEYWIDLTNDLLSFYKEELSGETNNYVHIRARNENKSTLEVLSEMKAEMIASRDIIHASLAGNPRALQAWKAMEQGYIHWHLTQERYRLQDLGLLASFSEQSN